MSHEQQIFICLLAPNTQFDLNLFSKNQEFQRGERNHSNCKNSKAPKKMEDYWVVAPWLVDKRA